MSESIRGSLSILRAIQQKSLSPKCISTAERRHCVEHLVGDGRNMTEIAEILQISARTGQRDLACIREEHAITASPEVTRQAIGQLMLQADQAQARLHRLARDKSVPPSTQVEAELGAWRVEKEKTELLQRLGILPLAAQEVRADIHHVVQEKRSLADLEQEYSVIQKALGSGNSSSGVVEGMKVIKGLLERAASTSTAADPGPEERTDAAD